MVVHCRTQHNWVKACGMGWEVGKVQTLFQGNHKKYFIVRLHTIEAPKQPVDDWMLRRAKEQDAEEDERLGIVDANQHMLDKSLWMRRTWWLREFTGKNMTMIVKKSWRPSKEEEGLQLIWRSVGGVLDTCVDGVIEELEVDIVVGEGKDVFNWLCPSH
jgi:hypothetical protein